MIVMPMYINSGNDLSTSGINLVVFGRLLSHTSVVNAAQLCTTSVNEHLG